jgi:hypothetical protein
MKKYIIILCALVLTFRVVGGTIQKAFHFDRYTITRHGTWQTFSLDNTRLAGKTGEPVLPYHPLSLILPPGEKAVSIEIRGTGLVQVPGHFRLFPKQEVRPISEGSDGRFICNEETYKNDAPYPLQPYTHLTTGYLNGFAIAMSTFTPVVYNPVKQTIQYYRNITVIIQTRPDPESKQALNNISGSDKVLYRVGLFAQNPEIMDLYPQTKNKHSGYQILIITPSQFVTGFQQLISHYNNQSIIAQVATTETINNTMSGQDLQEKIRNYIIQEYQLNGIEHVLLGGDVPYIPYRGFYCYVISGSGYEDYDIPADLYYSALDGNWNTNGNNQWGEPGEDDLLPDVSVARLPFSDASEQAKMIHKSVSYQDTPVTGELTTPLLVGEHLYSDPMTWGQDYLELLVDDHNDNGYFTHGIPHETNTITRLYDTLISPPNNIYQWAPAQLIDEINEGHSFIHHAGHSNVDYMMRLFTWDITNANFSQVNGTTHNYTLLYSHGCLCGAFENEDCIAEVMVSIDNFLAAAVVNSRYGWFDQGLTEGPSAHLNREFVSALYNDTSALQIGEIGAAHMMSKIKSAPWVTIPNQFEPGAQRWCHYCCNVLGDPAMHVWTDEPGVFIPERTGRLAFTCAPNPCTTSVSLQWNTGVPGAFSITLTDLAGHNVCSASYQVIHSGLQTCRINLSGMAAGVYFIFLESSNMKGSGKLIKMN